MNETETSTVLSQLMKQATPEPDAKTIERVHARVDRKIDLSAGRRALAGLGVRRVFNPVVVTSLAVVGVLLLVVLLVGKPFGGPSSHKSLAPAAPTCSSTPAVSLQLGGTSPALRGNPVPAQLTVAPGKLILVTARLGTRTMSYPKSTSGGLSELCHPQSGSSYATLFVANLAGVVTVESHTANCQQCAQLSFTAKVRILG